MTNALQQMDSSFRSADLIDQLASKLEHLRTVTWSVVDQVERLDGRNDIRDVVSGEVGLIYSQLVETQRIVDKLSLDSSQSLI